MADAPANAGIVTPEQDAVAKREAHEKWRQQTMANVAFGLDRIGSNPGLKKEIEGILATPGQPQDKSDVLALRRAYQAYKDQGIVRGEIPEKYFNGNPYDKATQEEEYNDWRRDTRNQIMRDMDGTWRALGEAEEKMRSDDPQGWNALMNSEKEEYYKSRGISNPDRQAMYRALGTDLTGFGIESPEYHESYLRLQAKDRFEFIKKMDEKFPETPVDDPGRRKLQAEANDWLRQADDLKAARNDKMVQGIDLLRKGIDNPAMSSLELKAWKESLRKMEQEYKGFIDPDYKIAQAEAENREELQSVGGDTPMEKLRNYYANLVHEERMLWGRISGDATKAEALDQEIMGIVPGGGREWTPDELRYRQVRAKIRSLAPVVHLNEADVRREGGITPAARNFTDILTGRGGFIASELGMDSPQQKAGDITEAMLVSGLDPERAMTLNYKDAIDRNIEGYSLSDPQYWMEQGGMVGAILVQALPGTMVSKGLGADAMIARMGTALKAAKAGKVVRVLANTTANALKRGGEFEISGQLSPNQKDELNFASGLLGGVGETMGKSVIKTGGKLVSALFGDRASQAMGLISRYGAELNRGGKVAGNVAAAMEGRSAMGVGESFGESVESLVHAWQQSEPGHGFWQGVEDEFGKTFDDKVKFFVSTFALGFALGGGNRDGISRDLMGLARAQYDAATPEQQRQMDEILEDTGSGIEQAHTEAVEQIEGGQSGQEQQPAMELTSEAQAAQEELKKRRELDQQLGSQGNMSGYMGTGSREASGLSEDDWQEQRIREDFQAMRDLRDRRLLDENETRLYEHLETVVTGLDQMRNQTAFREVAPASEGVSTDAGTTETGTEAGEETTPRNTVEIDGQQIELPVIEGLNPPQAPVPGTVQPSTETPVAPPAVETPAEPLQEAQPPKRRDQEIADQINEFFNGLAGSVGEAAAGKIKEYVDRIIGGESRESIIQNMPQNWIDAIDRGVELRRSASQEVAPESENVVEQPVQEAPAPKPLEAGDDIEYMGGPKGNETKRSGKVKEVMPNGDYRVEINVGGQTTETVVKKDKVVRDEAPVAPPAEPATTETATPTIETAPSAESNQAPGAEQQPVQQESPQTPPSQPSVDSGSAYDAGLTIAESLARNNLFTRENWTRMMRDPRYRGALEPHLDKAWDFVSRRIAEGTVLPKDKSPATTPPSSRGGTQSQPPGGQRERGLWRTFDRHRETNPGKVSEVLDRARKAARTWYTRLSLKSEFAEAEKEIEANGGYFEEYDDLSSNSRVINEQDIPRRRAKQLLSIRFFGDLADQLADEMENAETPEAREQARKDLEAAMERVEALSDIAAREGTAYGQANALNSQWRGLMENTAAYISNAIERHNKEMAEGNPKNPKSREKAKERKKKTRETRETLNQTRDEAIQDIELSESVDNAVDAVENETAKPKEKPARKKKGLGKTKEQIAEMKRKALEDMQRAAREGFAGSLGSPAAFNFLEAAGRYGYALVAEGIVTFKEWSAKMKQDIPAITDDQLQDVWQNQSVEGDTIANHARGEVEAAATPRKRTAAQKKGLRGKIRDAINNHFKKGADPNTTLQERLMAEADLTAEEAQYVYEAVRDEVRARAEEKIRKRANALRRRKPRQRQHDPKSDIEKAIEAMVDGEFTDDMVRDIFADRLGFGPKLTAEQIAEMRRLGKALQEAPPGSRLEQMAAMALDRYASQFVPRGSALSENWDIWKSLVYASVLSGVPTHIKNILSSSSMMALVVADGFTNISKWVRAFRTAWKAKDGEKMKALARANPVTEMVVKIGAMIRAIPKGFDAFMDIMKHGVLDSKYLERNQSKLGRLQSPLERTTFRGGKLNPYNAMKYVGRLLAAEDAFMFTIAHEAELADAVRRSRLESAPGNIVAESRKALAEDSQEWQDAMTQAETEVQALQPTLKLPQKEMERAIRRRAREILHDNLGLSEQMMQDAEDIAKSRIFTLKREGFWGKLATGMKMLNSNKTVGKFTWPFIMFTDIVGNLGDTMADFSPVRGIARANGVSPTGVIQSLGGMDQSSRMSERTKEDGKSWWHTALGSDKSQKYYEQMGRAWQGKVFFLALIALLFGGDDDDDRWIDFTGSGHPSHPNFIMIDGEPFMSWLLVPALVPAAMLATNLKEQIRANPNMSKDDLIGWGKRLTLAMLAAETGIGKFSIGESTNSLFEFFSAATGAIATGNLDFKTMGNFLKKTLKDLGGVLTKPLPQRITFVEQVGQLLDPTQYSQKNIDQILNKLVSGVLFRNATTGAVEQIDMYGNVRKRGIGSDITDYRSIFGQDDEKTQKRDDFLYEHGMRNKYDGMDPFWSPHNNLLYFKEGEETVKRKMDEDQFKKYAELSGKRFAEALDAYMDNRSLPPYIHVPDGHTFKDDYKTPQEKEPEKTMLEKKLRDMMSKARDEAKKEMDKIPVSEGGFGGNRL